MKKKLVAFLMAVCMAVPSVGTVGATVEAADKEEAKVIDVTKYGADPTGATDSTPAIKKAIEAAKKVTKKSDTPVVIDFGVDMIFIRTRQKKENCISRIQ